MKLDHKEDVNFTGGEIFLAPSTEIRKKNPKNNMNMYSQTDLNSWGPFSILTMSNSALIPI